MTDRSTSTVRARRAPARRAVRAIVLFMLAALPSAALADVTPIGARPSTVISSGTAHTCALDFNGNVQCWGANAFAQLGASPDLQLQTAASATEDLPQPAFPALGSCSENLDCQGGNTCNAGTCGCTVVACPGGATCGSNGYCPTPGSGPDCTANAQCGLGPCIGLNASCTVDAQCYGGATCVGGQCNGGLCQCGFFCPGSSVCNGGTCVPPSCTASYQCPWGYACSGGACVPAPPVQIPQVPIAAGSTPPLLGTVLSLATGDAHSCALLQNGTIQCWGENSSGQLGNGSYASSSIPVTVSGIGGGSTPAIAVAAGAFHTCAALADGTVACWGDNSKNQLTSAGVAASGSNVPVPVAGAAGVSALSAGRDHTCAIAQAGLVECWGGNDFGQLGRGTTGAPPSSAMSVSGVGTSTGLWATSIASGRLHSCAAVVDDGSISGQNGTSVVCWGYNGHGQLGDGTTTDRSLYVTSAGVGYVRSVSANGDHSCALIADGTVQCWGDNGDGELGRGTTGAADTNRPDEPKLMGTSPMTVPDLSGVRALSSGYHHTCAVLGNGTVQCWGSDVNGRLGDNHVVESDTPTTADLGIQDGGAPFLVQGGMPAAGGLMHTCTVIANGKLLCWGYNASGQIGNGTAGYELAPTVATVVPSSVISTCAGYYFTCALTVDGSVWCFGDNSFGETGDGSGVSTTPVTKPASSVVLGSNAQQVVCGTDFACALLSDGTVECWGDGYYGELGNGTSGAFSSTAVQVVTQAGGQALGGILQVAAGGESGHACALKAGGAVYCWGYDETGRVGPNIDPATYPAQKLPVTVPLNGGIVPKALAIGGAHSCALATNGTAQCWGYDYYGDLGDDNTSYATAYATATPVSISSSPPTSPLTPFPWIASLTGGAYHGCAVKGDGTIWCWGRNVEGQVGNPSYATPVLYPVPVLTEADAGPLSGTQVAAGDLHTCATGADGTVSCWGYNDVGALDNGNTTNQPSAVQALGFPRSQ